MSNETLIIMGSSRVGGNTAKTVERLNETLQTKIIDLSKYDIGFYDYEFNNQDDDFIKASEPMVGAQKIIFATPVYWYAMSAPMKLFFDRLSDFLRVRKQEGRALKNKEVYLLSSGTQPEAPEYFARPFEDTCKYLDMHFCGHHYVDARSDDLENEQSFIDIDIFAKNILQPCEPIKKVS